MAFRSRRQARYARLRDSGWLKFEAVTLSRIKPKYPPYYHTMIRARSVINNRAEREGWSDARYIKYIYSLYNKNKWMMPSRTGKLKPSPWALFRSYEDKYKDRDKEYTSPWLDKQKKWRGFLGKYERGVKKGLIKPARSEQKYPTGKHYKRKGK